MHRAATVAKGMAVTASSPTRVEIMDSGGAAMLQGFVVLAAARAAAEGASLEEVTRVAESVRSRVRLVAVIDTLKYLGPQRPVPEDRYVGGFDHRVEADTLAEDGAGETRGRWREVVRPLRERS